MADSYTVIGTMSGTSLDGVDLACCRFKLVSGKWNFELLAAETKPYSAAWKKKLSGLISSSALDYALADVDLGHYFAKLTNAFIRKHNLAADLVASHGHTIFHQPSKKLTAQIGNGAALAAVTGLPVVCDFRGSDVAKKGQGAPLVPAGDKLLFGDYAFCLNLGGIANISYDDRKKRLAYDICPVNMAFNYLASKVKREYDKNGRMAASGKVNEELLGRMNRLSYYKKAFPKSLGAEWFESEFKPLLGENSISVPDKLATVAEHICIQLLAALLKAGKQQRNTMLVTGGGAFNSYLVERMRKTQPVELVIPDHNLISFKEAIIFAFLGLLRWRNEENTWSSVTGALKNSSSGAVYSP
jgi:anhydro-N-acetylmuramic acid kinase